MDKLTPLLEHDMRRTTAVLAAAAQDSGDEFLQYLYGMAALHLDEQSGKRQGIELSALDDFQVAIAAKLIVNGH